MQDTELDPVLSETLQKAGRHMPTLVIANKNYSSWSMRPWVTAVAFDIPFKEVRVLLDQPETAGEIARYTGSGRVPVLLDGDIAIWDSLSICEYLAEQFPDRHLWPARTDARAIARSICAEIKRFSNNSMSPGASATLRERFCASVIVARFFCSITDSDLGSYLSPALYQ